MKTHKHLYPLITEFENLHLAFKRAARGKRSRWGKTSEVFIFHLVTPDKTSPIHLAELAG